MQIDHYNIIKNPLITEKTTIQKEKAKQFSFEVDKHSNRIEIKNAIEHLFNTKVAAVRTIQVKGKRKQKGRIRGKRRDWKKAIVTLMPGQEIEFFEGI